MRRAAGAWVLAAGLLALVAGAPAARAETAYRYWSYWQVRDGAWSFATVGPAASLPEDGAVEGWRFVVTTAQGTSDDAPRLPAGTVFDDACGGTPSQAGRKRIAILLDFGTVADAPTGQEPPPSRAACVVTDPDASGAQVLGALADIRAEGGLVCAIDGYPASECAAVVDASATPPSESSQDPESTPGLSGSTALLICGALLMLMGIARIVYLRRRGS